jgi:YD repeat-containing protein
VNGSTVTRDARSYTTTFFYHAGDATGRFADYGRPWSSREVGDAGTRDIVRTFDYGVSGYLLDRVASLTTTMAGESAAESWTYNATSGFLESATRSGITTTLAPNPATGAVSTITDPHNHVTSFTYDWGVPKNVTTPMYGITRTINADGTVASETRRGATTAFEYDALGRITWLKPPLGFWTETLYDNTAGRTIVVRRADGQGATSQTTSYLDAFGRLVTTDNAVGVRTRVAYDALGRKAYESFPYTTADVGRTFRYDVLGRLREVETGDGKKVSYAYSNGSDVTITDREGRVTLRDSAAFGSPDDARLMAVRDGENQTWSYEYNVLGRLTRVYQPGGPTRQWDYTGDLLMREFQPESGETTHAYVNGRLATTTTPRGTFRFGYDDNDRLKSIDAPGTAYDVGFDYDDFDNRTLVQNSFVQNVYEFDPANRLFHRREVVTGEPERQTLYTYDGWDNLTSVTYPSGIQVNYTYDLAGRATSVTRGLDRRMVAEILEYHPSGSPASIRFANGVEETYSYDPNRYWLQQISDGPVQLAYTHDGVGNVQSITDTRPQFNQTFTYDHVNRLRVVSGWAANEYQYDALGNRTTKASPGVAYTYDPATKRLTTVSGNAQIPEVGTYSYDDVGNLRTDPSGSYTYTPFNMLETATVGGRTATYRYDGNNERKARLMSDETVFFYHGLGAALLSEYTRRAGDTEGHWVRDHIYLAGRPVASVSRR